MWLSGVPYEARVMCFGGDLVSSYLFNLRGEIASIDGICWKDFWATACHCVWLWRNKELHDDDEYSRPMHPVMYILQRTSEYHKARVSSSSMGYSLLKSIRSLLDEEWEVKISHSFREAKKCVDTLANMGCTLDCNIVFSESCLSNIRDLFSADVVGLSTPA
ncbi:hypothetical protein TSUD_195720 [Trifolium subterraneum]|nr:hypothetical protein TSUD_195720 [Trifolium subterraneum]